MWAFKAVDKREKMLCLHFCYICKYLAYLCRVQKKQHWLSLSGKVIAREIGTRPETSHYILLCLILNFMKILTIHKSQMRWQTIAILALGRLRQEDLSSRESGLYTTFLDWPGLY